MALDWCRFNGTNFRANYVRLDGLMVPADCKQRESHAAGLTPGTSFGLYSLPIAPDVCPSFPPKPVLRWGRKKTSNNSSHAKLLASLYSPVKFC